MFTRVGYDAVGNIALDMNHFEWVLDSCLQDMQFRRSRIQDCLRAYPELAVRLEPLLRMADSIRTLPDVRTRKEFRQSTRQILLRLV